MDLGKYLVEIAVLAEEVGTPLLAEVQQIEDEQERAVEQDLAGRRLRDLRLQFKQGRRQALRGEL